MKQTTTINLGGIVFNIDIDAFDKLDNYLKNLSSSFAENEEKEIVQDIEQRIAELLSERINPNHNAINVDDIQYIIDLLGTPNQISQEEGNETQTEQEQKVDAEEKPVIEEKTKRQFYRDIDNKLVGGVGAGIAAYLDWDVTLVRLLIVLLSIASLSWGILIYLILWVIVPAADTPTKKMRMHGIKPTIDNIKDFDETPKEKSSGSDVASIILKILLGLFIAFLVMLSIPLLFVFGIVLFVLFVLFFSLGGAAFSLIGVPSYLIIILIVCAIVVVIMPIIGLVELIRYLISKEKKTPNWKKLIISSLIWLAALITSISLTIHTTRHGTDLRQIISNPMHYINVIDADEFIDDMLDWDVIDEAIEVEADTIPTDTI